MAARVQPQTLQADVASAPAPTLQQGQGTQQQQQMQQNQQQQQYKYKYTGSVMEEHKEPIFCIAFNSFDLAHRDLFASVGQHRASIYRILPAGQFELLQVFEDGDPAPSQRGGPASTPSGPTSIRDSFYCCKWSREADSGAALLLLAGEKALVRVLDVSRGALLHTFAGHGKSINDIAVHPRRPHLFLSASEDESVRLWNLRSRTCVAIFSGEGGHRNKVLTLDFHPWDGHRFLSAGMDNAIKIWSLRPIERLIEESEAAVDGFVGGGPGAVRRAFPTRVVQQPLFSTLQVHNDYVDCVRWLGDLVLSKSVKDVITLWRPRGLSRTRGAALPPSSGGGGGAMDVDGMTCRTGADDANGDSDEDLGLKYGDGESVASRITRITDFTLTDSRRTWFVRFSSDLYGTVLACGNTKGRVFVFSPLAGGDASSQAAKAKLRTPMDSREVVRQTAVSWDGAIILAAFQDGSIHRWDRAAEGEDVDMKDA